MFYVLVYYPNINAKKIEDFRKKCDPCVNLIGPHVTIIFPVPESIGEVNLIGHIRNILARWEPFDIRLNGLVRSWDYWLFLVLQDGNASMIKLHDDLYSGILSEHLRTDMQYIPHVSLGLFVKNGEKYDLKNPRRLPFDQPAYDLALKEAQELDLDYKCSVDKLHLVKFDDNFTRIVRSKEFSIGRT